LRSENLNWENATELIKKVYELKHKHPVKIYILQDFKVLQNEKYFFTKKIPKYEEVFAISSKTVEQLEKVIRKYERIF